MSLITIDQLLESVDLDFEPRWVTKEMSGVIYIWSSKPEIEDYIWDAPVNIKAKSFGSIKLAEFADKDWQECIYEVPRKTTGKIEKLETTEKQRFVMLNKINELVEYVNALIESNNIHEKQIDELQMKIEPEKCAVNELKGANQ
jgi:hypothetical protein